MKPSIDSRWSFLSLRAVILENALLRVTVLPEIGGRIWSMVYKPLDRELLWQNPRVPPRKLPFGAAYDDVWCGGWEEIFPTDAPGVILGERYPDHGEVWAIEWDWRAERGGQCAVLHLECESPVSAFRLEKRIALQADEAKLILNYRLTNGSLDQFPFLWKLHPALRVSPDCRIDFPPMTVELEPEFPGTLAGAPARFAWPCAELPEGRLDLREVPPASSRRLHFFYGTGYERGWCAITDTAAQLSYGLVFPAEVFRSCWLFGSFGGWRSYNVAVIEPSTTYPLQIERAIERGTARTLAPGESLEAEVVFAARRGAAGEFLG